MTADRIKLLLAVLIGAIGISGFYYFGDKPELIRVLVLLAAAAAVVVVAMQTAQGRAAWEFAKGSRMELRKVVWPSNKETVQMTLVVIAMVIVVAIFLWIVDWGLLQGIRLLTGRG